MGTVKTRYQLSDGTPYPLGASVKESGVNFALVSKSATAVTLCLFDSATGEPLHEFSLDPQTNRTGDVWHAAVEPATADLLYAYKISPPLTEEQKTLLDPYAKVTNTPNTWGEYNRLSPNLPSYCPKGAVLSNKPFDWEGDTSPHIPSQKLILYEMHVRGLTRHPSSQAAHPGTFLGIIEKIPHLLDLGINAVELLPIQEFNELEYRRTHPKMKQPLFNYWGYSSVNFFAPMNRYAAGSHLGDSINEFKTLVRELHRHKIEVILDVVFNHTAEGDKTGPVLSYKGIDNAIYYMLGPDGDYLNFSGCGNTVNANDPSVTEMIIDCLRYWVAEMHVDGFRFDLASALTRAPDGTPLERAPLIEAITKDPLLSQTKLIAEPWDAAGLYQVGNFAHVYQAQGSNRWMEWNGKYRDTVRKFIKGTPWTAGEFAMRLCGSDDLYGMRGPTAGINFVTCHDGFSLADLVSYNEKHNLDNGEDNRDGTNDNFSWNCGVEGPTANVKIQALRERQMRNFHLALMLSIGVPMLHMGDEYGHTKRGNNNTWCQDNDLNWFDWHFLKTKGAFYRFYRGLIHFRKEHPALNRSVFLNPADIDWHGIEPFKPQWNQSTPFVAYTLKDFQGGRDLYVAFNAQEHAQTVHLPPPPHLKRWQWVVNTANPAPEDFYGENTGPLVEGHAYKMNAYSAIMLQCSM